MKTIDIIGLIVIGGVVVVGGAYVVLTMKATPAPVPVTYYSPPAAAPAPAVPATTMPAAQPATGLTSSSTAQRILSTGTTVLNVAGGFVDLFNQFKGLGK